MMYEDEGRIKLSSLDSQILTVLLIGQMGGYEVGKQCQLDDHSESRVSNGSLYHSLNRLKQFHLVEKIAQNYRLTPTGRMALEWEISRLEKLVKLARKRN